jgi:hypothetical protein
MELSPDNWGDDARQLLDAIVGPKAELKRTTLLLLANARYAGDSQNSAFAQPGSASKPSHYKWMANDPNYITAFDFFIGDKTSPGLALAQAQQDQKTTQSEALATIAKAREITQLGAARAAQKRIELLEAQTTIFYHGEPVADVEALDVQLRAANAILNAASSETAEHTNPPAAPVLSIEELNLVVQQAQQELDAWQPDSDQGVWVPPEQITNEST